MKDIFKILRENGIEAHKGKQKDIRRLLNKNFIAIYLRRWYYILIHFGIRCFYLQSNTQKPIIVRWIFSEHLFYILHRIV